MEQRKNEFSNPEGIERKSLIFNPFGIGGVFKIVYSPQFHWGLFVFNPFGITRFQNHELISESQLGCSVLKPFGFAYYKEYKA